MFVSRGPQVNRRDKRRVVPPKLGDKEKLLQHPQRDMRTQGWPIAKEHRTSLTKCKCNAGNASGQVQETIEK